MASAALALTPQHLRELRGIQRLPGGVGIVLEATAILLGAPDTRLQSLRKALQGNLPERLRVFNLEGVTLGQLRRAQKLLSTPSFDEGLVQSLCPAAVPLAVWCTAVCSYLTSTGFGCGAEVDSAANATASQLWAPEAGCAPDPAGSQELQEPQPQPEPAESEQGATVDRLPTDPARPEGLVIVPDLTALTAEEKRRVSELVVSKPGIGSIVFHGTTDCMDLDVPSLVHLDVGEVLVYPNPGTKPPVGQGLNKRATVTMHGCWPPNGRGLKDARAQERYRQKIKQMTEEKSATFLDYDCSTGIWRFRVEHF